MVWIELHFDPTTYSEERLSSETLGRIIAFNLFCFNYHEIAR